VTKIQATNRTDTDIAKEVLQSMKADLEVPEDHIQAKVTHGVVTLFGTVARDEQKLAAETCLRNIHGVRGIRNLVEVDPKAAVAEV